MSDILFGADTPSRDRADGRSQVSNYVPFLLLHLTATTRGAVRLYTEGRTTPEAVTACQRLRKRWKPARAKTVMEGTSTGLARDARTTTARHGDSAVALAMRPNFS